MKVEPVALLPCPFCGTNRVEAMPTLTDSHSVICHGCGIEGPECDTEGDAIEEWNRRAIPPGYALVRVEQVKEARDIVAKEYAADRHNARLYKAMDLLDQVMAAKGE